MVVLLLLGNVFTTAGPVQAQGNPGQLNTALVQEAGAQPAGTELAAIEIKARDASTDALITGACFYANATSKLSGTYGCDGWDGKYDGVTTLFARETGTYEVGVHM